MSETLTMNETPADQPALNADEQDSLAIAESNEAEQQQLFAGKFKDTQSLEQAYLELQKKLGESRDDVRTDERDQGDQETEASEEVEEQPEQQADVLTEAQAQQLFQMVGGEKAYQSMIKWAAENLSQPEIDMYDSVVGRADPSSVFFAVQALAAKYADAVGKDSQLLTGRSPGESTNVFRSQAELVQAMSDPRYDNDPAYRNDVIRKLEKSDIQF
jgi:hypothetical protein